MNGNLGGVLVGRGLKVIDLSEHNPKKTERWFKLLQVLRFLYTYPTANVQGFTR